MAPKITSNRAESSRKYYEKNRESILEKRRRNRESINEGKRTRREVVQDQLRALKESTPCADCGVSYPWYVTDYDHVRGQKVANVAKLVSNGYSWEVICEEIMKCELVCANCHRERTHGKSE